MEKPYKPKDYHIRLRVPSYNVPFMGEVGPVRLHVQSMVQWNGEMRIQLVAEFAEDHWMVVGESAAVKTGDLERAMAFAHRRAVRMTKDGLDKWWFREVDKAALEHIRAQEDYILAATDRLKEAKDKFTEVRAKRGSHE